MNVLNRSFRTIALCGFVGLVLTVTTSARAENWAQWRGPAFNGTSPETGLPEKFSKTEHVAWVCALGGESAATPIIWEDRVFVTSHDQETKEIQAICVNRKDGKIRWKKAIGLAMNKASPTGKNTYASPSPVTDGEHVWFITGTGEVAAFDMEGTPLWSKNLPKEYGPLAYLHGYSSSPLLLDKKLYIQYFRRKHSEKPGEPLPPKPFESYLICLDGISGKEVWKQVREGQAKDGAHEAYTTPIPYQNNGKTEILALGANALTAHDPATGKEIWRYGHLINLQDSRLCASPLICNNVICVGESQRNETVGIRPGGSGDLPPEYMLWKYAEFPANVPTPTFYNGLIYTVDHLKKTLSCLKPDTGERVWANNLGITGEIAASPTAADGKIYILSEAGDVLVIGLQPEFKILNNIQLDDGGITTASIAVAYKHLFIRSAKNLYCIGD